MITIQASLSKYSMEAVNPEYDMDMSEEEFEDFKKMSPEEKEEYLQNYAELNYFYIEDSDIGEITNITAIDNSGNKIKLSKKSN